MITGAVLAGGKSLRYGRNKSLEVFEGRRLIDRIAESIRAFCAPVFIVANDLSPYYDVDATLVRDIIAHQGPLGGIFTALLFSPNEWVFAKATDMPFLVPALVEMMLECRDGFDVVVPVSRGLHEPLFALYHRRCTPAVGQALEQGEKKIVSFYGKMRVHALAEEQWRRADPEGLSFLNVNTPEDMEKLKWI